MTYEVVSVALGKTSVWTVEARNQKEVRQIAKDELRRVVRGDIVSIRPIGYKPKREG